MLVNPITVLTEFGTGVAQSKAAYKLSKEILAKLKHC